MTNRCLGFPLSPRRAGDLDKGFLMNVSSNGPGFHSGISGKRTGPIQKQWLTIDADRSCSIRLFFHNWASPPRSVTGLQLETLPL